MKYERRFHDFKLLLFDKRSLFVFFRTFLKPIVEASKNMADLSQDSLFNLLGGFYQQNLTTVCFGAF